MAFGATSEVLQVRARAKLANECQLSEFLAVRNLRRDVGCNVVVFRPDRGREFSDIGRKFALNSTEGTGRRSFHVGVGHSLLAIVPSAVRVMR